MEGLSEHVVRSTEEIKSLMKKGSYLRTTAATKMNKVVKHGSSIQQSSVTLIICGPLMYCYFTVLYLLRRAAVAMPCSPSFWSMRSTAVEVGE